MFKCEQCNKVTKVGEKQTKKVVQIRQKEYYFKDKNGNDRKSTGTEIVKEINLCENCANKQKN